MQLNPNSKLIEEIENESFTSVKIKKSPEKSYSDLEALLQKTDSQLQGLIKNTTEGYVVMDLWGNILKLNSVASKSLGFDDVNVDFNLLDLVYPNDFKGVVETFKSLLKKGNIRDYKLRICTPKKEEKQLSINASVIYYKGHAVATQGIVTDVTEIKDFKNKLLESEMRLATLVQNLDGGVLFVDENRKIVSTNNLFCELLNIPETPNQLKGQDCKDAAEQNKVFFKSPELFVSRINAILKHKKAVFGDELEMIDGKILKRDYIPIKDNNKYKGHLWIYREVL